MRQFDTGATRDTDEGKLAYRGFFCPLVKVRRAEYMHEHRLQADGKMRDPDNWKKGMPMEVLADSEIRHNVDFELLDAGYTGVYSDDEEKVICAIMFNLEARLSQILRKRGYLAKQKKKPV